MTEGQRLDKLRISLNKSWNALAKMLGLSGPATLYMIRDGKREISPELMGKIEEMTNGNPEYIRTGEGEMFLKGKELRLKEDHVTENCLLCKEKERYIKALEDRVESQKRTIEHQEECIDILKSMGERVGKTASE